VNFLVGLLRDGQGLDAGFAAMALAKLLGSARHRQTIARQAGLSVICLSVCQAEHGARHAGPICLSRSSPGWSVWLDCSVAGQV
jgi:hypothetical protein